MQEGLGSAPGGAQAADPQTLAGCTWEQWGPALASAWPGLQALFYGLQASGLGPLGKHSFGPGLAEICISS